MKWSIGVLARQTKPCTLSRNDRFEKPVGYMRVPRDPTTESDEWIEFEGEVDAVSAIDAMAKATTILVGHFDPIRDVMIEVEPKN